MKAVLRLQNGITTKAIDIPDHCVRTEYKLPIYREMKAAFIGEAQDLLTPETTQNKCLIFRWKGNDYWGNSGYPIMDLVEIY